MENESKIKEWMNKVTDFLNEQVWVQQLKTKWEELDPQSKNYLRFAVFGSGLLLIILIVISSMWNVHRLKSELTEKKALLTLVQSASEELRRLKTSGGNGGSDASAWAPYFESIAGTAGVDKSNITIGSEKPGATSEQSKEVLFELGLKHVNIKQVIRYAFMLESGQRPVKLRNVMIDTKGDQAGYLDATLAVSAFTLVNPK